MKIEDQKCPKCGHPVGRPVDGQGHSFQASEKPAFCFCVRCLSAIWLSSDKPPTEVSNKELFSIILLRPAEMMRFMEMTLLLNKNLPGIDAEKN